MEEINCPLCNKGGQPFWYENGYIGRKCFQHSLIYLSPRPNEEEMQILYNTDRIEGLSAREQTAYSFGTDLMARYSLSIIKTLKTKGDLLEIGAGGGQFLLNARKEGFNPFAIEINQELISYLSRKLGMEIENASASDGGYFSSRKFDVIYHRNVLSHLHDPIGAFKISNNRLKEDGILVFETGNFGSIQRFWLNFLSTVGYPEHLYLHSIKSVQCLLEISGFKLITFHSYSIIPHQLISKLLEINRHEFRRTNTTYSKMSFFRKFKDYITYLLVYRFGRILPRSWPATLICIAKKNKDLK